MEARTINIVLGLLTILSFVWSYVSEENRAIAIIFGFILTILIIISERNKNVQIIEIELKRLQEKLKIHEHLIDMKKDIELLKEKANKK